MSTFLATITDVATGRKMLATIEAVSGNRPDQGLPPGFGGRPDQDLPWHGHPDQGLPGYGHPSHPLPPLPPDGARPGHPIVLPPQAGNLPVFPLEPGNELPGVPPGTIWPPLPPSAGTGKAVVLVLISGVGWRWTVIDTSLSAGYPLPPAPAPK